jgi:hypothetical protein
MAWVVVHFATLGLVKRSSSNPRPRQRILAVVLVVTAMGLIVGEPFPKGVVLLALTETHGIDAGDVPALALLLVAGWLAI